MHDPSLSHSRPRLGCFFGTLSPSRRQIRSTTDRLIFPARLLHQPVDLAVTVPAVLPGQFDHVRRQALLVGVILGRFTLRRTMLPNH